MKSPLNSPQGDGRLSVSPQSDLSGMESETGTRHTEQFMNGHDINAQSRLVPGCDNSSNEKNRYHSSSSGVGNRSPPGFEFQSRDAGADPRLSSNGSLQSIERLRQYSEMTNPRDLSVFSHLDTETSVFSTGYGTRTTNEQRRPVIISAPDITIGDSANNEPKPVRNKLAYLDRFEQTFSPSFLGGEADETFGDITTNVGRPSLMKFDEGSLLDITSPDNLHNKTNTAEMQERIKSLEDIIKTYEEQIRQKSRPDMDSLQQQLIELRNLRIQLEKSMARNEILEKQLADLYRFSESTIYELKHQLAESEDNIREKVCYFVLTHSLMLQFLMKKGNLQSIKQFI